ncbi:MAG: glycosyltransferase [Gemmatimonadota bacterium]|nr:MAG: glycosyltransferase [Gemmatimonadota bacterium]
MPRRIRRVSVVIPARNSQPLIAGTVRAIFDQRVADVDVDVIVVDDGSTDETAAVARGAGARIVTIPADQTEGNPAAARNRGAAEATGDLVIFIDDDCTPAAGWLDAILSAHGGGAACVGGSLALPPGLPPSARLDYYSGWYHVHPKRPPGVVPNHPPGNISVDRALFSSTAGFTELQPIAYSHEELEWQAELRQRGVRIVFEPRAVAYHRNRPGLGNLLRRNYRWAHSSIEIKAQTQIVRWPWLYRFPISLVLLSFPLAFAHTGYIIGCWVRAGVFEPVLMLPGLLLARLAYATGMTVGGIRWLRRRRVAVR